MNLKHCVYTIGSIFILTLSSCLGDKDEETITYSKDAQLLSFQLKHDSVPDLANVLYSINQLNGSIYNVDSLTFGYISKMPDKAVFNFSTAGYAVSLLNQAMEDSVFINSGDSIDIRPFINQKAENYLRVHAYDESSKKEYDIDLRIHLTDPDSIAYNKWSSTYPTAQPQQAVYLNKTFYAISGSNFYSSSDAKTWNPKSPAPANPTSLYTFADKLVALTTDGKLLYSEGGNSTWKQVTASGISTFSAILGEIKAFEGNPPYLAVIALENGKKVYARTDLTTKTETGEEVAENFPVKGYASASWAGISDSKCLLIGGITESNKPSELTWLNTGDGLIWSPEEAHKYKGGDKNIDVPYESPNLFRYNNMLYLMNGKTATAYNDSVYISIDEGYSWEVKPAKHAPTGTYIQRNQASVCVDADNYIYILGGKNDTNIINDVWRGRLNRLGYK